MTQYRITTNSRPMEFFTGKLQPQSRDDASFFKLRAERKNKERQA